MKASILLLLPVCATISACDPDQSVSTPVELVFLDHDASLDVVTGNGVLETAVVQATLRHTKTPADGVPLTLATNATGIAFSPASAITGSDGTATVLLIVPFGATIIGTAVSGDGTIATQVVDAASLNVSVSSDDVVITPAVGGSLVTVTATTTTGSSKVSDVSLVFSTNTSGVAFAPGTAVTDLQGHATSQMFVQYATTEVVALIAGGGGSVATPLTPLLNDVDLHLPTTALKATTEFGGTLVSVTATAAASGKMLSGFPISFSSSQAGASFAPVSAITAPDGTATSSVFVPFGLAPVVTANGGGSFATVSLVSVLPKPTFTIATPVSEGAETVGSNATSTGQLFKVQVMVTDGTAANNPLVGLSVSFSELGIGSNGNLFSPTAAITDSTGVATSHVFVPDIVTTSSTPPTTTPGSVIAIAIADGVTSTPFTVP